LKYKVKQLSKPNYHYIFKTPPYLHRDLIRTYRLTSLHPLQGTSLISDSWIIRINWLLRSSEEMSYSMNDLSLSSLNSLSKYSYHLFLIYSSLVMSRSVSYLMHLTWMVSISSSICFCPSYRCPLIPSYLATLLSSCIHIKHSFFSLIAFCTFLFYHHVSLTSRFPPLITLNSSDVIFLMQMIIFIHMLFVSPLIKNSILDHLHCLFLSFHHFIIGAWTHLLR
jgi:hypothetical protein